MPYISLFLGALILAAILTPGVAKLARRFGILDRPGLPRKIHSKPVPLLGGIAPYLSIVLITAAVLWLAPQILFPEIPTKHLLGVGIGGLLLILGGILDDRYDLRPRWQIVFPVLAAVVIIASGIGIREITNPFGGVFSLVWWEQALFWWQGIPYRLTLPSDLFTLVWILGMIYTTKFLDGLDGLVSGLTVIGAGMIFFLTLTAQWYQPEVGALAAVVAGGFAGFLIWNWHPAKIFLGTGGSTLAGFLLGTLAIISGGKIATALLVFGVPILDAAWVIGRRVLWERKLPTQADRKHLHFRLLDSGFSHRSVVLTLYLFAALFGALTLVLQSREKLMALIVLLVLMVVGAVLLVISSQKRNHLDLKKPRGL